jgi:hypothetical protein
MNVMFQKIRKGSLAMTLKPGDGADVVPNLQQVVKMTPSDSYFRKHRSYFIYRQDGKGFHSPS